MKPGKRIAPENRTFASNPSDAKRSLPRRWKGVSTSARGSRYKGQSPARSCLHWHDPSPSEVTEMDRSPGSPANWASGCGIPPPRNSSGGSLGPADGPLDA